ncbi:MAG: sugar phosphate isomerase/epimerase family protein [Mycetocola reblochoni]|nr:sugar phosphate isomerase/epimerase [Mycetocola reblochoni]RLP70044.1 sugar phosphate isomerase/epimerase [Mycetocola reblochoni]
MIRVGMSSSCVYPLGLERAFALAEDAGYDGIEVMVTNEDITRDAEAIRALSERHRMPVLSVHAPVLLLTHFVWGRDPAVKLRRSAELAAAIGAETVVVHPPFRWQRGYAQNFLTIVRETEQDSGVDIAVENMFPWAVRGRTMAAYSPGWSPEDMDCDHVTLDFSHASLSGLNSLELARRLGPRLQHIHLCDGSRSQDENRVFDEHLVPGHGAQPVAETLRFAVENGFAGHVVAEINTRGAKDDVERLMLLEETLQFARTHLGQNRTGTDHLRGHRHRSIRAHLTPDGHNDGEDQRDG